MADNNWQQIPLQNTQPWTGFNQQSSDISPNIKQLFSTANQQNPNSSFNMTAGIPVGANNTGLGGINIPSPMAWKDMNWSQRLFGFKGKDDYEFGGAAMPALQLAQTGLNAYTGMKQLGIAEDSLAFQKDAFSKQFENQRKLTNSSLEWRQNQRNAYGSSAMPTDEYMKKYGV